MEFTTKRWQAFVERYGSLRRVMAAYMEGRLTPEQDRMVEANVAITWAVTADTFWGNTDDVVDGVAKQS